MVSSKLTKWTVILSGRVAKSRTKMPLLLQMLARLIKEIAEYGPIRKSWSHFGKLKKDRGIPDEAYHCHIQSGRPPYVACWYIENKKLRIIEIFYVGTYENTPY